MSRQVAFSVSRMVLALIKDGLLHTMCLLWPFASLAIFNQFLACVEQFDLFIYIYELLYFYGILWLSLLYVYDLY